jgi:phosphate transport system permease protein
MTAIDQRPLRPGPRGRVPAVLTAARQRPEQLAFALPLVIALIGMVVATATVLTNGTDPVIAVLLLALGVTLGPAVALRRARAGVLDLPAVILAVLAVTIGIVVALLPLWIYGFNINGIVSRTVVSGPALLVLGTLIAMLSIRRLLAESPSGQDLALVPLFAAPIVLGIIGFVLVLGSILVTGISRFRFDMLTTAWGPIAGTPDYSIGYLNNILGTFLLLGLTLVFAVLPGVGAGVFMSEYPGRISRIISFCATMLRAIAIFIFGAVATGVVKLARGLDSDSFLSLLVRGGWDDGTRIQAQKGSFVLAAVFLALLVMPVIARLTEEGLRSVPREIREGSVGLGATDGYSLRRILLPWAAPNILTAIIVAGAEAAGGLGVIWFIAGTGEHGVGLFSNVTDLDFAVFAARFGPRPYALNAVVEYQMAQYQQTAAMLLLVLTVGLTLLAMLLQRRFAKRYRGSITA